MRNGVTVDGPVSILMLVCIFMCVFNDTFNIQDYIVCGRRVSVDQWCRLAVEKQSTRIKISCPIGGYIYVMEILEALVGMK